MPPNSCKRQYVERQPVTLAFLVILLPALRLALQAGAIENARIEVTSSGAAADTDEAPKLSLWNKELVPWIDTAAEFYVAPEGSALNEGTADSPWDLESVLTEAVKVPPGSVVWVRGGQYGRHGRINASIRGTRDRPVIIRAYPGERATVYPRINTGATNRQAGAYCWFWGLEMTDPDLDRTEKRSGGINLAAPGGRAINLINHDCGHCAVGFWVPCVDGVVHGCIFWANGMYDQTEKWKGGPRGSCIYAQNSEGTHYITDVISFRSFTTGFKAYTEYSCADGFHIEGNVCFDTPDWNIFCASKTYPMQRLALLNNFTYSKPENRSKVSVQMGYYDKVDMGDAVVRGNYLVMPAGDQALFIKRWTRVEMTGNTLIGSGTLFHWDYPETTETSFTIDNNAYYGAAAKPFRAGEQALDFKGWKETTGFDTASTFVKKTPSELKVFVRPNQYEPGRGHVIIYNWPKRRTAAVDISTIVPRGTEYEIRDAQNYYGQPVVRAVYRGGPVNIPMNLTEIARPLGNCPHLAKFYQRHTAPEFGVFVVITRVPAGK